MIKISYKTLRTLGTEGGTTSEPHEVVPYLGSRCKRYGLRSVTTSYKSFDRLITVMFKNWWLMFTLELYRIFRVISRDHQNYSKRRYQ